MPRLSGALKSGLFTVLVGMSVPLMLTGCKHSMIFPSAATTATYNDGPIQQVSGEFRPVIFVSSVQDDRPETKAGKVGSTTFDSAEGIQPFIKSELEGYLSSNGATLARSREDAQSQSHSNREVVIHIRSASYGGATQLLHKTVAGINLLIRINDETGRSVFSETYFGSADKYPAFANAEQSGGLMAVAVRQAMDKALRDTNLRAALGL